LLTTKQHGEKTGLSVSSENASQKMFIGNDTISEIVNDSDSDGGNFSKLSDDTCKLRPVPVAVHLRRRSIATRLLRPRGSNPTGGMDVCL
jgi:hypothetical protein